MMSVSRETDATRGADGAGQEPFGIHLTERAAEEVRTILEKQNLSVESTFLRVAIKGGGCSGFSYVLDLAQQAGRHDNQAESHGIRILCDPKSYLYLNGTTIDFQDELMGRGFVFHNPNATRSCGCGASFSA
jgi:iron-sulfur cluster assembly protein